PRTAARPRRASSAQAARFRAWLWFPARGPRAVRRFPFPPPAGRAVRFLLRQPPFRGWRAARRPSAAFRPPARAAEAGRPPKLPPAAKPAGGSAKIGVRVSQKSLLSRTTGGSYPFIVASGARRRNHTRVMFL